MAKAKTKKLDALTAKILGLFPNIKEDEWWCFHEPNYTIGCPYHYGFLTNGKAVSCGQNKFPIEHTSVWEKGRTYHIRYNDGETVTRTAEKNYVHYTESEWAKPELRAKIEEQQNFDWKQFRKDIRIFDEDEWEQFRKEQGRKT